MMCSCVVHSCARQFVSACGIFLISRVTNELEVLMCNGCNYDPCVLKNCASFSSDEHLFIATAILSVVTLHSIA